jgi:hypothetical protein
MSGLKKLLAVTGFFVVSLGVADGLWTPSKGGDLIKSTTPMELIVPGLGAMTAAITGRKNKRDDE